MQKSFSILIAILAWVALIGQFGAMIQNRVTPIPETIIRFISFFTILTNLMVAIFFTGRFFNARFTHKPGRLTAVALYILIVCLVYQFLLRHLWSPKGLQMIVDELLHTVIPLLVIIFWFCYEKKAEVRYGQIITWIIYPLVYLVYILIRGNYSGFYPYPFVDVGKIGLEKTLLYCGMLLVFFVLVSCLFVWIGKITVARKLVSPGN